MRITSTLQGPQLGRQDAAIDVHLHPDPSDINAIILQGLAKTEQIDGQFASL